MEDQGSFALGSRRGWLGALLGGRLFRDAGGGLLLKVAGVGLVFVTSLILTRTLGAARYGAYATAISWVALLAIPSALGLGDLIVRNVAAYGERRDWGHIRGLLRRGNQAAFVSSVAVASLAAGTVLLLSSGDSEARQALLVGFLLLPILTLIRLREAALRGFRHSIQCQIPEGLVQPAVFLVFFAAAVLIWGRSLGAPAVLALYFLAALLALSVAVQRTRRLVPEQAKKAVPEYQTGPWAKSALPLLIVGAGYAVNFNADIAMLGALSGSSDAGVYHIATRLTNLVGLALIAVVWPLAPVLASHFAAQRHRELRQAVLDGTRLSILLATPIAAAYFVFGDTLMGIFGPEFKRGYTALIILTGAQAFHAFSGPVGHLLAMTGHEKAAAAAMLVSAAVNVTLNAIFIPLWGIEGAAIATAISLVVWKSLLIAFVYRHFRILPSQIFQRRR